MERTPEANGHHEYFLSADNLTQYGGPSVERIPIRSREDLLAAVPYLLGFHPQESTVVVGLHGQENSVGPILRYDMTSEQIGVAHHAIAVLQGIGCEGLVLIGYGADQEVTPVVDKMREAAANAQLTIKGALRVEGGRYWSYIDDGDTPFPPDGRPFDVDSNAVATKMALLGATALGGRSEFAKRLEPTEARVPDEIFDDVDNMLRALAAKSVRQAVEVGRQHVQACLRIAREGARLDDRQVAWLAIAMRYLAVRDDAWARMDPEYRVQHRDLWLDVVRRVPDQHITAPGCMLAFTAWQNGHGVLANIALDRVQRTDPEYSLASLLRRALDSGAPPRVARLPMTPEEVADSYEISFGPESTEVPALDLDDPTIRRMYGLPPSQGTPESEQGPGA